MYCKSLSNPRQEKEMKVIQIGCWDPTRTWHSGAGYLSGSTPEPCLSSKLPRSWFFLWWHLPVIPLSWTDGKIWAVDPKLTMQCCSFVASVPCSRFHKKDFPLFSTNYDASCGFVIDEYLILLNALCLLRCSHDFYPSIYWCDVLCGLVWKYWTILASME